MPRVVFVCVENSCRSQMAEAFTRMYASGQVEAYSAGSRPSGKVNPRAIEFMGELSYDLTTHQSKGLDALPPGPFAAAITMSCGDACPNVPAAIHEDWGIPDPKELPADDFRRIRDQIGAKVRELLGRIAQPIT
jgi:arsenate reductase